MIPIRQGNNPGIHLLRSLPVGDEQNEEMGRGKLEGMGGVVLVAQLHGGTSQALGHAEGRRGGLGAVRRRSRRAQREGETGGQ